MPSSDLVVGLRKHPVVGLCLDQKALWSLSKPCRRSTAPRPGLSCFGIPKHVVYVTDWNDARRVPAVDGPFTLDDCVAELQTGIRHVGVEQLHVLAICQASVPALAAVSLLVVVALACQHVRRAPLARSAADGRMDGPVPHPRPQ